MSANANKALMQRIFDGLAQGDAAAFRESLAEDFVWDMPGTTAWSGVYEGRRAVMNDLFRPLFTQWADTYTNTAINLVAEGDQVVVECRGKVTTTTGEAYNNTYCWVCRIEDGKLKQVTEYMDTALVDRVLAAPVREVA